MVGSEQASECGQEQKMRSKVMRWGWGWEPHDKCPSRPCGMLNFLLNVRGSHWGVLSREALSWVLNRAV